MTDSTGVSVPCQLPDNGGPAFPLAYTSNRALPDNEGMTLLDYFAAMAMQGLVESGQTIDCEIRAYEIAGRMLSARAGALAHHTVPQQLIDQAEKAVQP